MKLPVVVWDLLFYKELVTDGINGRLAEVNRMDSLVKQTLGLLSDERCMTQFGENGRVTVSERYDWKRLSPLVLASMTGRA